MNNELRLFLSLVSAMMLAACAGPKSPDRTTWSDYLGGPDRNHFTTLDQITLENVSSLKVAWTWNAPDSGQMQMSPVIHGGVLYGVTAAVRAFALEAATGRELWTFGEPLRKWYSASRGVALWKGRKETRVLFTSGPFLYALDAGTGKPIESFGDGGKVDLHTGLPASANDKFVISSTPGTVFEDLIIMPVRLSEGADAAPGDIRAFNVITGELVWTFHTIPHPGEPGHETWDDPDAWNNGATGAANNWSGMSVDINTGMVFIPTGSAAPDFYGGRRLGSNLYANSLLALDARTGKRKWHYQFVHHDLWDRDAPTPPNLITVKREGKEIQAVAQLTKQGFVFLFERATGKPLFDIEERPVPPSALEGEQAWPTQPVPVKPLPFARFADQLTEDDISPYAPNREELLSLFRISERTRFAPPGEKPILLLPGYDGGAEWGGTGADPDNGILYVNANEMAWILQMKKADPGVEETTGSSFYTMLCSSCHQSDRNGLPASGIPSLIGIGDRRSRAEIDHTITNGKRMMTGFPNLKATDKAAIIDFLLGTEKQEAGAGVSVKTDGIMYRHTGYQKFLDSNGLPGIAPPWGTLNAIDMNTGEYLWKIPYGETLSLRKKGFPTTGSESYGGPVITKNGLLFIAGTKDERIRAYDRHTGAKRWEAALPAAAFATPATYMVNGKQYLAIACGGEKLGAKKGNQVVAFTLP